MSLFYGSCRFNRSVTMSCDCDTVVARDARDAPPTPPSKVERDDRFDGEELWVRALPWSLGGPVGDSEAPCKAGACDAGAADGVPAVRVASICAMKSCMEPVIGGSSKRCTRGSRCAGDPEDSRREEF